MQSQWQVSRDYYHTIMYEVSNERNFDISFENHMKNRKSHVETSVACHREQFERPIASQLQVDYLQCVCMPFKMS